MEYAYQYIRTILSAVIWSQKGGIMPYIEQKLRDQAKMFPNDPGELNFAVTLIIKEYLSDKQLSYSTINSIMTMLEKAKKFEFKLYCMYSNKIRALISHYIEQRKDDEWI